MKNYLSSDPSQTDRRSRPTSKIGGTQLQYILIHFKLLSGSKIPNPRTSSLHKTLHIAVRLHENHLSSDPSQADRRSWRTSRIGGAHLQYILFHFKMVSGSKAQNPRTSSLHNTLHIAVRLHVKSPKFRPLSDRPTVETDVQNRRCTTSIYIDSFQIGFRYQISKP